MPIGLKKLWVDDLRNPYAIDEKTGKYAFVKDPQNWHWAKTITEAIRVLADGGIEEVALDHDIMHAIPQQVTIPPSAEDGIDIEKVASLTRQAIYTPLACPEDYTAVAHYIAAMCVDERPKIAWIHTASESGAGRLHNILYGKVDDVIRRRL